MNTPPMTLSAQPGKAAPPRRMASTALFAGQSRIIIEHEGTEYLLQVTRQGKLILTK